MLKQVLGDGIIKIVFGTSSDEDVRFGLTNTSNYTARDIKINLTEFTTELRQTYNNGAYKRSDLAKNHIDIPDFPYLKPKQTEVFAIKGNDRNQRAYEFSIYCQHATFIEHVIVDKDQIDLKWYTYFKLYQVIDGKLILIDESASNKLPPNQSFAHLFDKYFVAETYNIIQDL